MRNTFLLVLVVMMSGLVQAQSIDLSSFSSIDDKEVHFTLDKPSVAKEVLINAKAVSVTVERTSRKDEVPRYVEVLVRYDDLNREKHLVRLDSFSTDTTFNLSLEWAEGRKVKDLEVHTYTKDGTLALTGVSYQKGGAVVDWSSTDLMGTGFADKDNALQNDVLVISSPIDAPPHLTKLLKPKVEFVASLANSEGEALKGSGVLTCYIIDLSEESVETKKFTVSGTPETFTLDLSDKDLTYGYLVTFQPVMGQPWVAIRQMQVKAE